MPMTMSESDRTGNDRINVINNNGHVLLSLPLAFLFLCFYTTFGKIIG